MKGMFFIGILVVMGYFLYTFYGKNTGMAEGGAMKNLTDAPKVFKEKADKAMKERTERIRNSIREHMPDE